MLVEVPSTLSLPCPCLCGCRTRVYPQKFFAPSRMTYVLPEKSVVVSKGGRAVSLRATSGARVGPPWQQKENGYIIRPAAASPGAEGKEETDRSICRLGRRESGEGLKTCSPIVVANQTERGCVVLCDGSTSFRPLS